MGFLGTRADAFTDGLIVGEIAVTALVFTGVRLIRRNHVAQHRLTMLGMLTLNLLILATFLVKDVFRGSNVIERAGTSTPLYVYVPLLVVHLMLAVTALALSIWAWRIARRGVLRDGAGRVINVTPEVRRAHRRISRWFPRLWYPTLATGLLFYFVVYA